MRKPKSFVTIFAFGNMRNIHAPFAEIYGVPVHAVFRIAGIENQIAVLGVGDIVYKGTAYPFCTFKFFSGTFSTIQKIG